MNQSPPLSKLGSDSSSSVLVRMAQRLAMVAVAYLIFAGLIYLFETIGNQLNVPRLGIAGLAIDIVLLIGVLIWAGRHGHPMSNTLGPVLALLVVVLFFAVADSFQEDGGSFWTLRNFRTISVHTSTIAVAALGMTIIIIGGGIDLSAGTSLALGATVLAYCLLFGYGISTALVACVLCGCLTGLLNGILVSVLRVVPFIITLGTMTAFLGIATIIANESTIRPPAETIPAWIPDLVSIALKKIPDAAAESGFRRQSPFILGVPLFPRVAWGIWLAMGLAVFSACLMQFTVFGRRVFALGSNESTARLCGVNVLFTKISIYAVAGLFVGIAGMYQFARLSAGNPSSGLGMELKIIAAVVIGGGSLSGGRGSIVGTMAGAAIMLTIASGCTALEIKNPVQDIIIGIIIIVAVTLDQIRQGTLPLPRWLVSLGRSKNAL